jgi:hypothetical protein
MLNLKRKINNYLSSTSHKTPTVRDDAKFKNKLMGDMVYFSPAEK